MAKRAVILGAAESGVGAAILARAQGYQVFLSDHGRIDPAFLYQLDQRGLPYEQGGHTLENILNADLIIKSPGIAETTPVMKAVRARGLQVVSEIEFGSWHTTSRIIAITGSNGKTTTTSLIYSMLQHAGYDVGLGGNIGNSFAAMVAEDPHAWYVLEVSSFQLDDIQRFHPHIAVITNITPNHLDRYGYQLDKYADAKLRITANQTEADYLIYSLDSETLLHTLARHTVCARMLGFSLTDLPQALAWVADGNIQLADFETPFTDMKERKKKKVVLELPTEQQKLKGKHNHQNTMASMIVGRVMDIRSQLVRESMLNFDNIEHRLEKVRNLNGVEYINDSKATSVNAAWYALDSQTAPIHWIVGGVDKGNDYGMLLTLVEEKVKTIIMLGNDVAKLQEAFTNKVPLLHATSMEEAVRLAHKEAKTGEVVLLSPACASFDLFKNYEERGQVFKACVHKLES